MRALLTEEDELIDLLHVHEPASPRNPAPRRKPLGQPRFRGFTVPVSAQERAPTSQPITLSVVDMNACVDLASTLSESKCQQPTGFGPSDGLTLRSQRLKKLKNVKRRSDLNPTNTPKMHSVEISQRSQPEVIEPAQANAQAVDELRTVEDLKHPRMEASDDKCPRSEKILAPGHERQQHEASTVSTHRDCVLGDCSPMQAQPAVGQIASLVSRFRTAPPRSRKHRVQATSDLHMKADGETHAPVREAPSVERTRCGPLERHATEQPARLPHSVESEWRPAAATRNTADTANIQHCEDVADSVDVTASVESLPSSQSQSIAYSSVVRTVSHLQTAPPRRSTCMQEEREAREQRAAVQMEPSTRLELGNVHDERSCPQITEKGANGSSGAAFALSSNAVPNASSPDVRREVLPLHCSVFRATVPAEGLPDMASDEGDAVSELLKRCRSLLGAKNPAADRSIPPSCTPPSSKATVAPKITGVGADIRERLKRLLPADSANPAEAAEQIKSQLECTTAVDRLQEWREQQLLRGSTEPAIRAFPVQRLAPGSNAVPESAGGIRARLHALLGQSTAGVGTLADVPSSSSASSGFQLASTSCAVAGASDGSVAAGSGALAPSHCAVSGSELELHRVAAPDSTSHCECPNTVRSISHTGPSTDETSVADSSPALAVRDAARAVLDSDNGDGPLGVARSNTDQEVPCPVPSTEANSPQVDCLAAADTDTDPLQATEEVPCDECPSEVHSDPDKQLDPSLLEQNETQAHDVESADGMDLQSQASSHLSETMEHILDGMFQSDSQHSSPCRSAVEVEVLAAPLSPPEPTSSPQHVGASKCVVRSSLEDSSTVRIVESPAVDSQSDMSAVCQNGKCSDTLQAPPKGHVTHSGASDAHEDKPTSSGNECKTPSATEHHNADTADPANVPTLPAQALISSPAKDSTPTIMHSASGSSPVRIESHCGEVEHTGMRDKPVFPHVPVTDLSSLCVACDDVCEGAKVSDREARMRAVSPGPLAQSSLCAHRAHGDQSSTEWPMTSRDRYVQANSLRHQQNQACSKATDGSEACVPSCDWGTVSTELQPFLEGDSELNPYPLQPDSDIQTPEDQCTSQSTELRVAALKLGSSPHEPDVRATRDGESMQASDSTTACSPGYIQLLSKESADNAGFQTACLQLEEPIAHCIQLTQDCHMETPVHPSLQQMCVPGGVKHAASLEDWLQREGMLAGWVNDKLLPIESTVNSGAAREDCPEHLAVGDTSLQGLLAQDAELFGPASLGDAQVQQCWQSIHMVSRDLQGPSTVRTYPEIAKP